MSNAPAPLLTVDPRDAGPRYGALALLSRRCIGKIHAGRAPLATWHWQHGATIASPAPLARLAR